MNSNSNTQVSHEMRLNIRAAHC